MTADPRMREPPHCPTCSCGMPVETSVSPTAESYRLNLTGNQARAAWDFCGGEPDTEMTLGYFEATKDTESGEEMPAGLYAWLREYPEEGRVFLPIEAQPSPAETADEPTEVLAEKVERILRQANWTLSLGAIGAVIEGIRAVKASVQPATTQCGSCGEHYNPNNGHDCPQFYAK